MCAAADAGSEGIAFDRAPEDAAAVLDDLRGGDGRLPGYRGGDVFADDGRAGGQVPPGTTSDGESIAYQEWDVKVHIKGVSRGGERLVTGSNGSAFYTSDHYTNFVQIP